MPPLYDTLISSIGALLKLSKPFQCDHLNAVVHTVNIVVFTDHMQGNKFACVARDLSSCDHQSTRV